MMRWILIGLVMTAVSAVVARYLATRLLGRGKTVQRLIPPGWLVWAAVFSALAITGVAFVVGLLPAGPARWIGYLVMVAHVAVSAVLLWFAFFVYVSWTTDAVIVWDPWRKRRELPWREAVVVRVDPRIRHLIVGDGAARTLAVPLFFEGADGLTRFLAPRLGSR